MLPEILPYQQTIDEIIKAAKKLSLVCDKDEEDGKAVYQDGEGHPFMRITKGAFCLRMAHQTWVNHFEMSRVIAQIRMSQVSNPGLMVAMHPGLMQGQAPPGTDPGSPPPGSDAGSPSAGLTRLMQNLSHPPQAQMGEMTEEGKLTLVADLFNSLHAGSKAKFLEAVAPLVHRMERAVAEDKPEGVMDEEQPPAFE